MICITNLFSFDNRIIDGDLMKVAVVFNEAYPEITDEYQTEYPKDLDFKPYFDLDESDPIAEYESIAKHLRKAGYEAYILNILDDLHIFLRDLEKNKPDVIFNFVEIYKDTVWGTKIYHDIFQASGVTVNISFIQTSRKRSTSKHIVYEID